MVNKSTERRLAAAEHQLIPQKPTIQEIFVTGGLVEGIAPQARIAGGQTIQADPGETLEDSRRRMLVIAESEGAKFIVYGGLPDGPVEWAQPPGQEEALARVAWGATNEMDTDD
jgi:hypothetical protein